MTRPTELANADIVAPRAAPAVVMDSAEDVPLPEWAQKVIFYQGHLWLQTGERYLIEHDPEAYTERSRRFGEAIADIHRTLRDELWVVTQDGQRIRLWKRSTASFEALYEWQDTTPEGYPPSLVLLEWEGRPLVMSGNTFRYVDRDGALKTVRIDGFLKPFAHLHTYATTLAVTDNGTVYVSLQGFEIYNALYGIELSSGRVSRIFFPKETGLGDVPFRNPFRWMIADPSSPNCILGGDGFLSRSGDEERGGMTRVCGEEVSWPEIPGVDPPRSDSPFRRCPSATGAAMPTNAARECVPGRENQSLRNRGAGVFGLTRTQQGYWLMTSLALYHVRDGKASKVPFPTQANRGKLKLGWTPGALFASLEPWPGRSIPFLTITSLDETQSTRDIVRWPGLRSLLPPP